ncbi:hypothetical protein BH09ACT8_BH09ACT8_35580 [soil metagenome]
MGRFILECMFDMLLPEPAELARRRCHDDDERDRWACDPTDSAAAEVAAALNIGHGRAITQLKLAQLLRDRLPTLDRGTVAVVGKDRLAAR